MSFDPNGFRVAAPTRWMEVPPDALERLKRRADFQQNLPRPDPKLVAREHDGALVHLWGEIGEWAVAQALGIDLHRLRARGGDEHADLTLPNNMTCSVKATPRFGGRLLFRDADHFVTDTAVLVYVRAEPSRAAAWIEGWIMRREFMERCERFEPGRLGTELCVRRGALKPIEQLARLAGGHT